MAPVMQSSQPWVEKYRPKQVKDVAHQDEVVRVLTNTLETSSCPHMLFYGPPGTGKTTTALAIAHQLYGPDLYKSRVLELNASDDRGINVVRTKIKDFAAVAVGSAQRQGMLCDVQWRLTRKSRDFSTSAIILAEPLASRCAKFRFKPLPEEVMTNRILHICNEEGLHLDSEALSTLSSISQGDLRRAITYLQGATRLYGSSISSKDLISVSGVIPQEVVLSLFSACKSGNFDAANKEVDNVIAEGYPVSLMLSQLFDVIVGASDISDEQKARICKKFGAADKCLVDGADDSMGAMDGSFKKPGSIPFKWEEKPGVPKSHLDHSDDHHHRSLPTTPRRLAPPPSSVFSTPPPNFKSQSFRLATGSISGRHGLDSKPKTGPVSAHPLVVSAGCLLSPLFRRKWGRKKKVAHKASPEHEPVCVEQSESGPLPRKSSSTRKSMSLWEFSIGSFSSRRSSLPSSPRAVRDPEWAGYGLF
ncbi:hypothetical protein V2J09_007258 [Rumex salicifolius]